MDETLGELNELFKVRERLHKLADIVQAHEVKVSEHTIRIDMHDRQLTTLMAQTATREQLDNAVLSLADKLAGAVTVTSIQIKTVVDDVGTIKRGIYWVIGIVIMSVLLAVLALVIRRPGP